MSENFPIDDADDVGFARSALGAVRMRLTEGDVPAARALFDLIDLRAADTPDGLLTEGLLLEAEGKTPEALVRVQLAVAARRGSAQANAQLARLAALTGETDQAEAAARAALAVDPDNLDALSALRDVHARRGQGDRLAETLRGIALATTADEARVWSMIDELSRLERWSDILEITTQRGDDLNPRRVAWTRLQALLSLGWARRALAHLRDANRAGLIRVREAAQWLLDRGALTLAARFVSEPQVQGEGLKEARTDVIARVGDVVQGLRLADAPLAVADAIAARAILHPARDGTGEMVERAASFLVRQAGVRLAKNDAELATDYLVSAARLVPTDRAILTALAAAADRAGRAERHRDTLMRIAALSPDSHSVLAAAEAACEAGDWSMLHAVMAHARAHPQVEAEVLGRLYRPVRERLADRMGAGDWADALELVASLQDWFPRSEWPPGTIKRLLARTKRWLRSSPAATEATGEAACANVLRLDPLDIDVCRMLARIRIRQNRNAEARDLVRRALAVDPHVAQDWIVLAQAQHELGDVRDRDRCIARAIAISPDPAAPTQLKPILFRMTGA